MAVDLTEIARIETALEDASARQRELRASIDEQHHIMREAMARLHELSIRNAENSSNIALLKGELADLRRLDEES